MAAPNFAVLERPISSDEPCGPNLDLEGDSDFLQFIARTDSVLPSSFFTRGDDGESIPFDRSQLDFATEYSWIDRFLRRTHDLRILTFAGRLLALDRNLTQCVSCLSAVEALLRNRWVEVHPQGEDGDYGYRLAVLQVLDDMPTMILPLQHLPLFSHRRFGPISYRTMMVATGGASARPGEKALDGSDLERALREADPDDLAAAWANAERLAEVVDALAAISTEQAGAQNAVRLDRLSDLARGIMRILSEHAGAGVAEVPASIGVTDLASDSGSGDLLSAVTVPATASGSIKNRATVSAALAAVSGYFRSAERSSPAALLVRQAERLVGLSFHEALRALLPNHAEEASLYIGPKPDASFQLRIERIAELVGDEVEMVEIEQEPVPVFDVRSRSAAVSVLKEVGAYYRIHEPSSPIPLFTERACSLVNQDFLSILTDVLPGIRLARDAD
ncbi:type VI secretion system protein TssA [Methylorubrum aminovorans]